MTTSQDPDQKRVETRLELEETIFVETIASDSSSPGSIIMCNSLDLSANGLQVVVDDDISMDRSFDCVSICGMRIRFFWWQR